MPKVLAVFPEGHTSPKQTSDFIPLMENKERQSLVQKNLYGTFLTASRKGPLEKVEFEIY